MDLSPEQVQQIGETHANVENLTKTVDTFIVRADSDIKEAQSTADEALKQVTGMRKFVHGVTWILGALGLWGVSK